MNRIGGVMISMLVLSVADRGFEPRLGQPKTIQLVCVASLLRAKTGLLGIRILCTSGATCLYTWTVVSVS